MEERKKARKRREHGGLNVQVVFELEFCHAAKLRACLNRPRLRNGIAVIGGEAHRESETGSRSPDIAPPDWVSSVHLVFALVRKARGACGCGPKDARRS